MTLIALLHKNSFPMAITDNLISTPDNIPDYKTPDTPLDTKEILDAEKKEDNFYILGMASKIWRAEFNGEYLFLMYAGTVSLAKQIFDEYEQKFSYAQNDGEIKKIFTDLDSNIKAKYGNNVDVSGIFLHNNKSKKILYSHDFGNIIRLNPVCKEADRENIDKVCTNIAFGAGSGIARFLELIFKPEINPIFMQQLEYVWKHIISNEIENLSDYYDNCLKFSLTSVALATTEAMQKPEYSILTKNACGALYNLRHFIELYPQINQGKILVSDTGLCQIFTQKENNKFYINKFILTNYTSDNKTISFVLNDNIDITDYVNNTKEDIKFVIPKRKFKVFEIGNRYRDSIVREIDFTDEKILIANQLITYAYKDTEVPKFGIAFHPYLACSNRIVYCYVDEDNITIYISLIGYANIFADMWK